MMQKLVVLLAVVAIAFAGEEVRQVTEQKVEQPNLLYAYPGIHTQGLVYPAAHALVKPQTITKTTTHKVTHTPLVSSVSHVATAPLVAAAYPTYAYPSYAAYAPYTASHVASYSPYSAYSYGTYSGLAGYPYAPSYVAGYPAYSNSYISATPGAVYQAWKK